MLTFKGWLRQKRYMFSPRERWALHHRNKKMVEYAQRIWDAQRRNERRRTIHLLVTKSDIEMAELGYRDFDPITGTKTVFFHGLSKSGRPPATHYDLIVSVYPSEWEILSENFNHDMRPTVWFHDLDKLTLQQVYFLRGLRPIQRREGVFGRA